MHSQIVYDPLGRMTSKQADGQAVFANAAFAAAAGQPVRPHAMKSAERFRWMKGLLILLFLVISLVSYIIALIAFELP